MMIKFTEAANEVSTKVMKSSRQLLVSKQPAASVDTWKSAWTNYIKKKVNALFIHHYHDGKQKTKGSLQADKEFNDLIEEVEKQGLVAEVQRKKGDGNVYKIQKAPDVSVLPCMLSPG
jgi:P2-related tail formation protein